MNLILQNKLIFNLAIFAKNEGNLERKYYIVIDTKF